MNDQQKSLVEGATFLALEQNSDTEVTITTSKGEIYISLDHNHDETGVDYTRPFIDVNFYDENGNDI